MNHNPTMVRNSQTVLETDWSSAHDRPSSSLRTSSPAQHLSSHSQDPLLRQQSSTPMQTLQIGLDEPYTYKPLKISKDVKNQKYDDLKFVPTLLTSVSLAILLFLYIAVGAGVGVLWWRSGIARQFHISSENVHMIARYFPSIVGTITVLLFQQSGMKTQCSHNSLIGCAADKFSPRIPTNETIYSNG